MASPPSLKHIFSREVHVLVEQQRTLQAALQHASKQTSLWEDRSPLYRKVPASLEFRGKSAPPCLHRWTRGANSGRLPFPTPMGKPKATFLKLEQHLLCLLHFLWVGLRSCRVLCTARRQPRIEFCSKRNRPLTGLGSQQGSLNPWLHSRQKASGVVSLDAFRFNYVKSISKRDSEGLEP